MACSGLANTSNVPSRIKCDHIGWRQILKYCRKRANVFDVLSKLGFWLLLVEIRSAKCHSTAFVLAYTNIEPIYAIFIKNSSKKWFISLVAFNSQDSLLTRLALNATSSIWSPSAQAASAMTRALQATSCSWSPFILNTRSVTASYYTRPHRRGHKRKLRLFTD